MALGESFVTKINVSLSYLKTMIYSPGDLYWLKKSGEELLITKKGEVGNFNLLNKIDKNGQNILIAEQEDDAYIKIGLNHFKAWHKADQLAQKDQIKLTIMQFLEQEFVEKNRSQIELDNFFWMVFSEMDIDIVSIYFDRSSDFFRRALSVSALAVFIAFVDGNHQLEFLKQSYTQLFMFFEKIYESNPTWEFVLRLENAKMQRDLELEKLISKIKFDQVFFHREYEHYFLTPNLEVVGDLPLMLKYFFEINQIFSYTKKHQKNGLQLLKGVPNYSSFIYQSVLDQFKENQRKVVA